MAKTFGDQFSDLQLPASVTLNDGAMADTVQLVKLLGQGGQGAVYLTSNPRTVVKLTRARTGKARQDVLRRLKQVTRLGLDDLPIALPRRIIESGGVVGYVATMLQDMVPLAQLLKLPKNPAEHMAWFAQTGGLARRYRLLAKTARILAALHARGACYGDLSPNNVFISEDPAFDEVWLIDADNIRYTTAPGQGVYTPLYGAPELVKEQGTVNTLTDAWSLAVLAFEMLTLCHPLLGDMVNEGEPELEEAALKGELPWIDDPDDPSNASSMGLPRELVLTGSLRKLAVRAFGAGRSDATARPTASEWAQRLSVAAGLCIPCGATDCAHSFLAKQDSCPFCDADRRSDVVRLDLWLWQRRGDAEGDESTGNVADSAGIVPGTRLQTWLHAGSRPLQIPESDLRGDAGWVGSSSFLEVTTAERGVGVVAVGEMPVVICPRGEDPSSSRAKRLNRRRFIDKGWLIHLSPDDQVHRVLLVSGRPRR